jgi:predicted nuclease of predicted toxin-antitoxin system
LTRILLDQGLPRSTVLHLTAAGWDVTHVADIGMSQATDREILNLARIKNQIVITLDADFHALLAVANESAPSVVRIRQEGLGGLKLSALLLNIWPKIEGLLQYGAMVTVTAKAIRVRRLPVVPNNP